MNIFVTNTCPVKSAMYLDDKRLRKMTVESMQMLSTAAHILGTANEHCYKSTHVNHPCNVWIRKDIKNFQWIIKYIEASFDECKRRFGYHTPSLNKYIQMPIYETMDKLECHGDIIEFQNCARNLGAGIDFTHVKHVPTAYKMYLNERWKTDKRIVAATITLY